MSDPSSTAEELATAKATHFDHLRERGVELQAQLAAILPASGELVCEIGCGHGHFLTAYAQKWPDRVCIGLDIVGDRIARANRKRERARLTNLHFLRAEARLFLQVLPPQAKLSALYILFPDPWPKARHHKHRIIQPELLDTVAGRMGQGARLRFRTDYEPYFAEARALFAEHPSWEVVDEPWEFEYETVFQSRAKRFYSLTAKALPSLRF